MPVRWKYEERLACTCFSSTITLISTNMYVPQNDNTNIGVLVYDVEN